MSGSLLDVAFAHTAWATLLVIDACLDLSTEQLRTNVLGTRGPIIETLRHIVTGDAQDLFILTGDPTFDVEFDLLYVRVVGFVFYVLCCCWW